MVNIPPIYGSAIIYHCFTHITVTVLRDDGQFDAMWDWIMGIAHLFQGVEACWACWDLDHGISQCFPPVTNHFTSAGAQIIQKEQSPKYWITWSHIISHIHTAFHLYPHSLTAKKPCKNHELPSGNLTVCYWKWPFIVDFPIKKCDFP